MSTGAEETRVALDRIFAEEWPRLIGYAARIAGDLDAAEAIVQDAMVAALRHWPVEGLPRSPGAWLSTTCRNLALNHRRDTGRLRARLSEGLDRLAVTDVLDAPAGPLEDDRLRLMFLCCHPALTRAAQVALTLRLVAGLDTPDVARAFHVTEATIAQRIVRAKRALADAGGRLESPDVGELGARLAAVLDVVYLVFNEGYVARAGESLQQLDLAAEAARLAHLLTELLPDEPQTWALLALIALQRSRAATRADGNGDLVTLPEQDRNAWDRDLIAAGMAALHRAQAARAPATELLLQAEIAACHALAPTWEDTDWPRILELYDALVLMRPSAVVHLNRAVAVGEVQGALAGLACLEEHATDPGMTDRHLYWSVRGEHLLRAGRPADAAASFVSAARLTANAAEQRFLARRLIACDGAPTPHHHGGTPWHTPSTQ